MEKIHVLQITVNKQKETFPIDTDFSEKALIIDIQGVRRGSAEIDKIIDGKIIKNHNRAPGRA